MRLIWFFLFVSLVFSAEFKSGDLESLEFESQNTQIFSILGVSTKNISYPGNIKDLKMDMFLDTKQNLQANIALEFPPIWKLFFKNKSYKDIIEMPYMVRCTKDLLLSIGNVLIEGTNYRFGSSITYPIYKQNDISFQNNLLERDKGIQEKISISQKELQDLRFEYIFEKSKETEKKIDHKIKEINLLEKQEQILYDKKIEDFKKENWNSTYLEVGYAFVLDYNLHIKNKQIGFNHINNVIFLKSGYKIGKIGQISLLNRFTFGKISPTAYIGGNVTFGKNEKLNMFVEYFIDYSLQDSKINSHVVNFGTGFHIKEKHFINFGLTITIGTNNKVTVIPNYLINVRI